MPMMMTTMMYLFQPHGMPGNVWYATAGCTLTLFCVVGVSVAVRQSFILQHIIISGINTVLIVIEHYSLPPPAFLVLRGEERREDVFKWRLQI